MRSLEMRNAKARVGLAVRARRTAILACGLFTAIAFVGGFAAQAADDAVDPGALATLTRMTDHLAGLDRFSVTTENVLEEVLDSGEKIQHDFRSKVTVRRPNGLRAERVGDVIDQAAVFDGKTLTIHNRDAGYWATTEAPGDIDDVLHFARDHLGMVPPSSDLIYTNAYELLTSTVTSGRVVGKAMVDGVMCDHLAFRNANVDWQIWIADGKRPLPLRYVLTTRGDPERPQYTVRMSDWNEKPKVKDSTFRLSIPEDAEQVEFLILEQADE